MYVINERKLYLHPSLNGLSYFRSMFQIFGLTPYMVIWGNRTPLSDASSVKIRNKHNFAMYQPIITTLVSSFMFSTFTFHLRAFKER